ncbi:cyclic AMP-responsive element-binding protein 5 isoform X3 [Scyliorhinus canicula]|uniref:cyclic AMP-responsive element-binding protein 5 isoform X3 n=1 Tax=Scyliorhinus canicula TaxID=7830 RepID=UPI0018F733F4|nr:cyclic AMP-responsive element-binding protein 5 isoform X3 [Scyliorhinus canicula]
MNLEQDRPFICNAPGCAQRFPTEDHLMIHRHKHEMTLKFPAIKTDNILSDQTPTPTRFLKNCEEVGLFNELACSLEQEFRKAQEEEDNKRASVGLSISNLTGVQGKETSITDSPTQASTLSRTVTATRPDKSISVHGSVQGPMSGPAPHQLASARMSNHDSGVVIQQAMPSPTSSSVITQAPSTNRQIGPVPGSLSSLLHLHNRQRQPMPGSMPGNLPNSAMPVSSAVLMPRLKAALSQHPTALSNGNMNMMGQVMEMMTSRQEQAPQPHHHMHSHQHQHPPHHPFTHQPHPHQHHPHHHQQNHPHSHPHLHTHPPQHQTPPLQSLPTGAQVSPGTQQMQSPQSGHPTPTSGGRRRRVVDEDPDERRRKFLERNRAAATRCRQKRKVWVISLEKKAEELTQTNMQLQNEVSLLKNEVAQLKQLLLTHKDCPITTLQEESQSYLSPENSQPGSPIPACSQQQVIQHNSISTSTAVNEVVGSSTLTQLSNQRTDLNPIL